LAGIGGFQWTDGWEVTWWTYCPAVGMNPPDYDDKQLYLGVNPYDAAKAAILAIHTDRLECALEYYGEQSDGF
jgi:hypothetical protein